MKRFNMFNWIKCSNMLLDDRLLEKLIKESWMVNPHQLYLPMPRIITRAVWQNMSQIKCESDYVFFFLKRREIKITLRFIPSGVVRENGAPYTTVSTPRPLFIHVLRVVLMLFTWPSSSIFDTVFSKINRDIFLLG